jgi:hypothetical protein
MALKSDFEGDSQINSPFVDEVANPGVAGTSNEEVERQAVRANQLFLAKQRASEFIKSGGKKAKPVTKPKRAAPKGVIQTEADRQAKIREALKG